MQESYFLKPADIAPLLNLSVTRIYQLLAAGSLPSVKVGGRLLVPRAAWEAWLTQQTERASAGTISGNRSLVEAVG